MEIAGQVEIVLLSSEHEKSEFDCGDDALNLFLRKFANQNQKKGLNVTYVAVRSGTTKVLGFYCISNGQIAHNKLPENEARKLPFYPIPVARIGRLATSLDAREQGIGALLLIDALKKVLNASNKIGIFAVEVDAKSNEVKRFYERYGFSELTDNSLHLYLSMATVRKLFRPK